MKGVLFQRVPQSLTESQWKANLHQAEEIIKEKDQAINYLRSQVAALRGSDKKKWSLWQADYKEE